MIIKTVTITGADDNTDINEMIEISKAFPFVEWGILFSKKRTGTPRYPTEKWVVQLLKKGLEHNMSFSAHLCGNYAKDAMTSEGGDCDEFLNVIHPYSGSFNRFQLNFNGQNIEPNLDDFKDFVSHEKVCIIQHNQNNKEVCNAIIEKGDFNVHFLYDSSGGNGNRPEKWKPAVDGHFTGYAGGLTPLNLMEELEEIELVNDKGKVVWIDVETGVRTNDVLDMKKVSDFLRTAKLFKEFEERK